MEEKGQQRKEHNLIYIFLKCVKNDSSPPFKSWRKYLGKKYSSPKIEILGIRRKIRAKQKAHKETSFRKIIKIKTK